MRPLTYFAFTLLSVVIQFCVMDFIQEKVELDDIPIPYNESINKRSMNTLKDEPNTLALYYRTNRKGYEKMKDISGTKYPNSSLPNISISTSTELAFTVVDVLYDENVSTTDAAFTTEFPSTELDNVTEITSFEQTSTTIRPTTGAKRSPGDVCYCNLLYKQCDVNCCCDEECSKTDKELFGKCKNFSQQKKYHPLACGEASSSAVLGNLLCIAKTNLPDQRVAVKQKINEANINGVFLWQEKHRIIDPYNFNRNTYKLGESVWILRNKSISYLDYPVPVINNYCNVRRKMTFLSNEKINCLVKLNDLEMFRVLKTVEESFVISVTNNSLNSTAMNCSSLYCTNWTVIYCNQDVCVPYNKSLHSPICTESDCKNIALKVEYIFNIYDSKIVNATIKLYSQKIAATQYVMQEVSVTFFIGNASTERVVTLSGNPGYIIGLPIITSIAEGNFSGNFFNSSSENNYISYADNKAGYCVLTKLIKKDIEFGISKRSKCRIMFRRTYATNGTEACINIQKDINKMAGVNRMYISPYGNPDNLKDDEWLPVKLEPKFIYGEFQSKRSKLQCLNMCTRFAFVFTYADLSDMGMENKLLEVKVDCSATNVTFGSEDNTAVITVDINFIKVNSAGRRDLAGPPHLNLNLPTDFFFPFPSNACSITKYNTYLLLYSFVTVLK